jgi:hypothetical protein
VGVGRLARRRGFPDRGHRPLRAIRAHHEGLRGVQVRHSDTPGHPVGPLPGRPRLRLVPRLPEGSLATALAVVGGVGAPSRLRRTATGRASTAGGSRPGSRRCA